MQNPEKLKNDSKTPEQEALKILEGEIKGKENPGEDPDKNPWLKVHGEIHVGKIVIPDYADVASQNAASFVCVDASNEKTGLGVTAVRIDDFNKDPANPVSQVTVLNPHWDKSVGNKAKVSLNSEFAFIDKAPELNGLTTKVAGTYDLGKGWNFEGAYFHGFNKGVADSDSIRATVEKKVNDALTVTAQGWYKSDEDRKAFGRVITDINLGNGFGVQLSCVWKNGKLEPTTGVCYKF